MASPAHRPHKFTEATVGILLQGVRAGLPYHLAAEAAGISEETFYAWQRGEFPRGADKHVKAQFSEELMRAKGGSAGRLMELINNAADDDWRAAAWILERRFPKDFGKHLVELSGPDGGPMKVKAVALQAVIMQALESHPEARVEVAQALIEAEETRHGEAG